MRDGHEAVEMRLRALVLGAAAGGGFPQWNCNCPNCVAQRRGDAGLEPRTQASIAVTANGADHALINAAPEITGQIIARPQLHPRDPDRFGKRDTPIHSVLITNADVDAIAGLLGFREKQRLRVLGTAETLGVIDDNPIFRALDRSLVSFVAIELDTEFELAPGIRAKIFPVPGKIPLYLEGEVVRTDLEGEQTVGVEMLGPRGERLYYIPGCARMTPRLAARLQGADAVFFDGTVYHDDEMVRLGVGTKTGQRMGHMAMSGPEGSMAAFAGIEVAAKVYIHINNTNPVLNDFSPERRIVEEAGWRVSYDGMEIVL